MSCQLRSQFGNAAEKLRSYTIQRGGSIKNRITERHLESRYTWLGGIVNDNVVAGFEKGMSDGRPYISASAYQG
jgi:hypothetical protein